jgi:hypothetical protein
MRRLGLFVLVLMLGACGALQDAFSAHPRVAGSAAGQDLTVERLATWVAGAKKVQPKAENFTALATLYLDYMVFAVQLAKGRNLDDSLLVLRANWPLVSQLKWDRFHDQVVTTRSHFTPAAVDSAYQAGDVRLFQHILIGVPASAAPPVVDGKRAQAERLRRDAAAQYGANFAALARRYSEDMGSKSGGGYLPASARGQFVAPFEAAAWELRPGAVSGVVRSPFGFHLIRRPPLAEVRDFFGANLERLAAAHFDSVYVDSLAKRRELTVKEGAPAIVRQVFTDLEGARKDTRTLVSYRNGAFRVKDLIRWIFALNPEQVRGLPFASDDQVRQFLTVVTQRDLLLAQVDSAGVQLTPDDWKQVLTNHDSTLRILDNQLGIAPRLLADSAPTVAARVRFAAAHVDAYLGRVLSQQAQFFPVPPFLAAALRESEPWSIDPAGVADAVDRAKALRAATDSGPRGGMRPAPGPPPIPLDTAHRRVIR